MRQVVLLYMSLLIAAGCAVGAFGVEIALLFAYGAISLMALMIAATFFWLWKTRATPLALGMSLSWAGSGLILGWWWATQIVGCPGWGLEVAALFWFLSLLTVGAVVHFSVIQGTFGYKGRAFLVPVFGAAMISFGVVLLL